MNRTDSKWHCINNCGACCRLAPDERLDAIEVLDSDQVKIYLKMVGDDGWCIHFDSMTRSCRIYEQRPDFCRVSNLSNFYNHEMSDSDSFAIHCCTQQIRSIYGHESQEMKCFNQELNLPQERNE